MRRIEYHRQQQKYQLYHVPLHYLIFALKKDPIIVKFLRCKLLSLLNKNLFFFVGRTKDGLIWFTVENMVEKGLSHIVWLLVTIGFRFLVLLVLDGPLLPSILFNFKFRHFWF